MRQEGVVEKQRVISELKAQRTGRGELEGIEEGRDTAENEEESDLE